ncbi:MAG: bifunctional methylenetetrahydrofolate dehydrogenase/methenyltetrahydrofolate cyclohydrolase FolD [Candidatus Micrarchaeota archaeon]|nr:bifunctional methylenetetrahydrofolate dehydrogenase/methenyltetrahydrofolate cyclohydrolase FolD [Candidatus Micrarchaeota archaeon]
MATLMDGKKVASDILKEVAEEIKRRGITPKLALVRVGEDEASKIYLKKKEEACALVGIKSENHVLPEDVKREELLLLLGTLNADKDTHGVLVQLPLPKDLSEGEVISSISPEKDVDGIHPCNMGKLARGESGLTPCTPAGIMELLRRYEVEVEGKEAVVVGASNIVGLPIALMLLRRNATVTVCHVLTKNLASHTKKADILVSAVGKPGLITAEMVKEGAVVIDVGITRLAEGLAGDVDFEKVGKKASLITPVPGGVGPMTVAMLMRNTLQAYGSG